MWGCCQAWPCTLSSGITLYHADTWVWQGAGRPHQHHCADSLFYTTGSRLPTSASLQLGDNQVYSSEISIMEAGLKLIFPLKPRVVAFKRVLNTIETVSWFLCLFSNSLFYNVIFLISLNWWMSQDGVPGKTEVKRSVKASTCNRNWRDKNVHRAGPLLPVGRFWALTLPTGQFPHPFSITHWGPFHPSSCFGKGRHSMNILLCKHLM